MLRQTTELGKTSDYLLGKAVTDLPLGNSTKLRSEVVAECRQTSGHCLRVP